MPGGDTFGGPADAYDRFVGRYGATLAAAFVEFTAIDPSNRVLDVGCGTGALSAVLAERVGPQNVAAVDPSASFAEACSTRVPGIEIAVASADALPFGDDSFDATLSQLVVNFIDDPAAGVAEMTRVTRRDGIVAACVWDYSGEMTLLRAFWDAARDVAPQSAPSFDEGDVMPWCRQGELAALWSEAGLASIRSGALVAHASYVDFEDLWSPLPTGVGPAGAFCKGLSDDDQASLRAALQERLGVGDGPFDLNARAWVVSGVVARVTGAAA